MQRDDAKVPTKARVFALRFTSMNRLSPAPPPPAAGRFPSGWRARLGRDPVPILLREGSPALSARVRRDLIDDEEAPDAAELVTYPEVKAFLRKQEASGAFPLKPPEKGLGSQKFGRAVATIRALERLADFGLGREHAVVDKAAEVLLDSQAKDGGILDLTLGETPEARGKSVALHFQGWALAALCRTGYDEDPRVVRGFNFLQASRQADGGWAWRGVRTDSAARPSSHLVTGMALRAFAASPSRRTSREAKRAAELLATRFLQPDRYPDRKAASFWEQLAEPRFYTDVLDALDGVTAVGLGKENSGVRTAEAYLRGRQNPDGLWYPGAPPRPGTPREAPTAKDREAARWLTVRVLIVLRRVN
jgi:Squalene-hopene cyclase C-terminal domain